MKNKITILGSTYTLKIVKPGEDITIDESNWGGYCNSNLKLIVLLDFNFVESWNNEPKESIEIEMSKTLRHELIHAYLNESGLSENSYATSGSWSKNEKMIDWLAIQLPKIFKTFKELECLDF